MPQRNNGRRFAVETLEPRVLLSSYFVSPAGSDGNDGSNATPWRTLQRAAYAVDAGDTVTVRAGKYAGFVVGWDYPQTGTSAAPIVFNADPGATIVSRNSKTSDGIDLEGASWITLDGFTVDNTNGGGAIDRAGIRAVDANHVTIRNCAVSYAGTGAIYTSHIDDVLIENNVTHDNNLATSTLWN